MEIVHIKCFDGDCFQKLILIDDNQAIHSVGIVLPGDYKLGYARARETFQVTTGRIVINGETANAGDEVVLDPEEEIFLRAELPSSFVRHLTDRARQ